MGGGKNSWTGRVWVQESREHKAVLRGREEALYHIYILKLFQIIII